MQIDCQKFRSILFAICCLIAAICVGCSQAATAATFHRVLQVSVVAKTSKKVLITWEAQANATGYDIRVLHNGGVVTTLHSKQASKTLAHLQPNTAYDIRVRAKTSSVKGKFSYPIHARTKIVVRQSSAQSPLFGFWGLNGYVSPEGFADVQNRFGLTVFQVASSAPWYTVHTLLPQVQAEGLHVTLRMTDDHDAYTTGGNFDLAKWKAQIDVWKDSGIQEFIDNGTLVGHMLLDDIDTFAGVNPTAEELDEMARYSKQVLPGLFTYVRQKASQMPVPDNATHTYLYLDAIDNQYTAQEGDVAAYAQTEYAAAKSLNLAVINGLNICDGGDGSSGRPGWRADKHPMTAAEITTYGNALLAISHVQMLLLWEYDGQEQWSDGSIGADYFNQSALQDALHLLGQNAAVTH